MKSTGEVMAIERSFEAAFSKALRSLEQRPPAPGDLLDPVLLDNPNDRRIFAVAEALRGGMPVARSAGAAPSRRGSSTASGPGRGGGAARRGLDDEALNAAKRMALADRRIAELAGITPEEVAGARRRLGLAPSFKCVDTCAAEFAAATPYYYSTVEAKDERPDRMATRWWWWAAGPSGSGRASSSITAASRPPRRLPPPEGGPRSWSEITPETVSTDFDCSTRVYFEPLDQEAVLAGHRGRAGGRGGRPVRGARPPSTWPSRCTAMA